MMHHVVVPPDVCYCHALLNYDNTCTKADAILEHISILETCQQQATKVLFLMHLSLPLQMHI